MTIRLVDAPLAPEHHLDEQITDEELATLALAADPDAMVDDGAVPVRPAPDAERLLPDWYMPSPAGGAAPLSGWRRGVALMVIAAFMLITALGLCNTYGDLSLLP